MIDIVDAIQCYEQKSMHITRDLALMPADNALTAEQLEDPLCVSNWKNNDYIEVFISSNVCNGQHFESYCLT